VPDVVGSHIARRRRLKHRRSRPRQGRRPRPTRAGFITTDDTLRTNGRAFSRSADCTDAAPSPHTSYNDSNRRREPGCDGEDRASGSPAGVLRSIPTAASTLRHDRSGSAQIRPSGLIATMPMEDVSRAFEKRDAGLHEDLVDKETRQFSAAALFGLNEHEIVHTILDQIYGKCALHRDGARAALHSA